jgi:type II secretory pathway component PulM
MSFESVADAWRNRPARERWVLATPFIALGIAALYIGVVEPLQKSAQAMRARLPALEARLELVRAQTLELRGMPSTARAHRLDLATVQAALERNRLKEPGTLLEAAGENRARLALPRAPFFAIWPLFQGLQNEHGIRIVALRIDRIDGGFVRVDAALAAGDR